MLELDEIKMIPMSRPDAQHCDPTSPARRFCPTCDQPARIEAEDSLWPKDWICTACGATPSQHDGLVQLAPSFDETDEGFDRNSFEFLAQVEDTHFWFVARNELIGWLVRRFAPDARRALEIGCGTGYVVRNLSSVLPLARVAGSELHSLGLRHARERCPDAVELFQMDARRSYLSNVFDLIGAFDVLEHIEDDEAVLAEIHRMLRPGAQLMVSVPQHPWLWSTADDLAKHQRRYRLGEMAAKVERAGFSIRYRTSFVTLPLPLMMASRALAHLRPRPRTLSEQTDAEFRLASLTNAFLLRLCRFEHGLRKVGVPLPVGGSQIVVAQKPI